MDKQFLILGFLQIFSFLEYIDITHCSGVQVSVIYQKLLYLVNWKK